MHNHTFTWNGQCSEDFGVYIEKYPDLNRSARKFKSASVPGRNGNIYQLEEAWEEVTVSYQIFAGRRKKGAAVCSFTEIMEWLHSADGYAELSDSYDYDHYRLGVFVDDMDIESQWHTFGKATIHFRCRPERFIVTDPISVESGDTITNPTNHIAKPIITLTGSGARSLFGIPLKNIGTGEGTSAQLFSIVNAWNDNYVFWAKKYNNQSTTIQWTSNITGTLNSLDESNGLIKYTTLNVSWGLGWLCPVNPNTNYVLTLTGEQAGKVIVWMAEDSGYNQVIKSVELTLTANTSRTITFTTPSSCGYLLVGLFSNSATSPTFKNIMLTTGTTVKPFNPHTSSTSSNITIGDVVVEFDNNGFDTAEIDCEQENFTLNDSNANNTVRILDTYGNLSADYLHLDSGNNTVTCSGDITAVTIEKRLWEL